MKSRIALSLLLICALLCSAAALAESDYEFDATVVCVRPAYVTAAIGGTVAGVPVLAGQLVSKGDVLAQLNAEKLYATRDGDITGVFCKPGDSVSAVTDRYGALMYIEPDSKYALTASTDNAYNLAANKYIHAGEAVYLACSDGTHTGQGIVTAIDGTDFTVEVTDGAFYMGETVSVYRDATHSTKSRIGRGDIERAANVAVGASASGSSGGEGASSGSDSSVVAVYVSDGDHVQAGDLLAETLSGEYDAYYCTGAALAADADGILAGLNVSVGSAVNKGDVVATVYPRESLQLKVEVNEADLAALPVGAKVQISFSYNEDAEDAAPLTGTVAQVLYAAAESGSGDAAMAESTSSDTAAYVAYVDFDAGQDIRLGMTATVRPVSADAADDEAIEAIEDEAGEA